MRDLFEYYAKCNRAINEQMHAVIERAFPQPYDVALGGYWFKTLGQLLDHVYVADLIWLKAFADLDAAGLDLVGEFGVLPGYGDRAFASFADYLPARRRLDDFICRYLAAVDASLFAKVVSRRTRDGQLMERVASKALVHFFNHQTHHRGQISNILDHLQIENNYSNMIFLDL